MCKIVPGIVFLLCLAFVNNGVMGELYVSATGLYNGHAAYTNLQEAISSAGVGETIYVEDGFLCDAGRNLGRYGNARVVVDKSICLRSRSGGVNPVVVRGAWHENGVPFGTNALRCIEVTDASAEIVGFRFEGGSTRMESPAGKDYTLGGGAVGNGTFINCQFVTNWALCGGGAAGGVYRGCEFSGNVATNLGGGASGVVLSNCIFVGNTAFRHGGGIYDSVANDCEFIGNSATNGASSISVSLWDRGGGGGAYASVCSNSLFLSNTSFGSSKWALPTCGGGGASKSLLYSCIVSNNWAANVGGGMVDCDALQCVIGSNRAGESGGGAFKSNYGSAKAVLCLFDGNVASGNGGGLYGVTASNCIVRNNLCSSCGGGAYSSNLSNCEVLSNVASNSGSTYGTGYGGGIASSSATRCRLVGNAASGGGVKSYAHGFGGGAISSTIVDCLVSNNWADMRGGGVSGCQTYGSLIAYNSVLLDQGGGIMGGQTYNSLIVSNSAPLGGGAAWQSSLYNCTLTGNSGGGLSSVYAVNTISWDNSGKDSFICATNCCSPYVTEAHGTGNIVSPPKLCGSSREARRQYVPLPGSPCINSGLTFDWMRDSADLRAADIWGRRRVIGEMVDIGAFEAPVYGFRIIAR